jgi:hypothetical protein
MWVCIDGVRLKNSSGSDSWFEILQRPLLVFWKCSIRLPWDTGITLMWEVEGRTKAPHHEGSECCLMLIMHYLIGVVMIVDLRCKHNPVPEFATHTRLPINLHRTVQSETRAWS